MNSATTQTLAGQRALVTGGTRGIGAATAQALAAAGVEVIVSARTAPRDCPFPVIEADLVHPSQVDLLAQRTLERLGGIDILISNVGGQIRRPSIFEFNDEDWKKDLSINLLAAVQLDRALVPPMLRQGSGAVVHVSSGAARIARANSIAYSASKAALNVYSKGLANEVGQSGVRVNVVSPGLISTSGIAQLAAERQTDPAVLAEELASSMQIPLDRAGTAEEAAQLIVFLVSPGASYLTGAQFAVDGGAFPTL